MFILKTDLLSGQTIFCLMRQADVRAAQALSAATSRLNIANDAGDETAQTTAAQPIPLQVKGTFSYSGRLGKNRQSFL